MLKYKIYSEVDLNDAELTLFHRKIIKEKSLLRKIYLSWYNHFVIEAEKFKNGVFVEIGSGGGFLKDIIPEVITSDIEHFEHCDLTFPASDMPFEKNSVDCIFMVNVFHHIPDVEEFLNSANEVLKTNGKIIMVEPSINKWSRFIYKNLHHETIDLVANWKLPDSGRLSDANIALPWIVFQRDSNRFNKIFPGLQLEKIIQHTPVSYLLSGGVSYKFSFPGWSFSIIKYLERFLTGIFNSFSMFNTIIIRKQS